MTFREWRGTLLTIAFVLIVGGLLLGSIGNSVSIGYGSDSSSLSCGSPWFPSAGDPITLSASQLQQCTAGYASRALLGADAFGLGAVLLMGMGLVQMALVGRREAQAAAAGDDKPAAS